MRGTGGVPPPLPRGRRSLRLWPRPERRKLRVGIPGSRNERLNEP